MRLIVNRLYGVMSSSPEVDFSSFIDRFDLGAIPRNKFHVVANVHMPARFHPTLSTCDQYATDNRIEPCQEIHNSLRKQHATPQFF